MRPRIALASTLLAALAGCAGCDTVPADAVTDCNAQIVPGGAATDILFVVDDSGSMSDKQAALASQLGTFIDQLLGSAIALDVRIGVTNTSVQEYANRGGISYGASSGGQAFPGVPGTPYPAGAIVAIDADGLGSAYPGRFLWGAQYDTIDPVGVTSTWGGSRILSSSTLSNAQLARDFKANVRQGDWGSGKEQPLRAMKLALERARAGGTPDSVNLGFLRPGARLAVVILTDEDDCSETWSGTEQVTSDSTCHTLAVDSTSFDPLNGFVEYLDSTVGANQDYPVVAVIAGFDADGNASGCTGSSFSSYANPRRLGALVSRLDAAYAGRTSKHSICQPFGAALTAIAGQIIPQTMPLEQAPADYRMITASVRKASGATVGCGTPVLAPGSAGDKLVYTPASQTGSLPTLTFQNACRIELGDKVELAILCAR